MQEFYDTTINTLRIRGSVDDRDRIGRELHQAHWPQPPDKSWVFVRKVVSKASTGSVTRDIIEQTRHLIEHGNDGDNVMRFASQEEMLAALLEDLVTSPSQTHWYWQHWRHLFKQPKNQAIASVLSEHLSLLNSITLLLAKRQHLSGTWKTLQRGDATQLIKELAWKNGYPLQSFHPISPSQSVSLTIPFSIQQRWRNTLNQFTGDDPRLHLGLILIAEEAAPLALLKSPEQTLAAIAYRLNPDQTVYDQKKNTAPVSDPHHTQAENITSSEDDLLSGNHQPDKTSFLEEQKTPSEFITHEDKTSTAPSEDTHYRAKPSSFSLAPLDTEKAVAAQPKSTTAPTEDSLAPRSDHSNHPYRQLQIRVDQSPLQSAHFQTGQGGVLYLLNFLNRQPLQDLMGEYWQQLSNGWVWLYRVAQLLSFDENDPLSDFIAMQIGLEHPGQLQSLPPLPEQEQVLHWAQQWYGHEDLWNPALLNFPANIRHSPSHIDMHADLSRVRLKIRLAGLDINPGWLPWLGRVVQFHFDDTGDRHE